MKLPGGQDADIDVSKLRDYCLSPTHLRGRHKARVFLSALGITIEDVEELRAALKRAAVEENAIDGPIDEHGNRYIIDFVMSRRDKSAMIRSCWIIDPGKEKPRFVTCFVL